MFTYSYNGPISHFERVIATNWKGYTTAPTPKKALANLTFKAKKEFGFENFVKLTLDEKFLKIEEKKND